MIPIAGEDNTIPNRELFLSTTLGVVMVNTFVCIALLSWFGNLMKVKGDYRITEEGEMELDPERRSAIAEADAKTNWFVDVMGWIDDLL
mmetsp:Transcript_22827/g.11032  ORF Transcript_22827/g.11032 Transcript_22827/m.11032 type:complete len:89 (-) Transcript_22827:162-428(-)